MVGGGEALTIGSERSLIFHNVKLKEWLNMQEFVHSEDTTDRLITVITKVTEEKSS